MGHYIEAKDSNNRSVSTIGYQVWNPNVKLLYRVFNISEPGRSDWSGNNEDRVFYYEDIKLAMGRLDDLEIKKTVEFDDLHPIVMAFTQLQKPEIDPEYEKDKLIRFLESCLETTSKEGHITINFG